MALGLHEIHKHQIVHADIKPHNLLIDKHDGNKKVVYIDFGLADNIMVDGEHIEE